MINPPPNTKYTTGKLNKRLVLSFFLSFFFFFVLALAFRSIHQVVSDQVRA